MKDENKKDKKKNKNKEQSERSPGKLGGFKGHSMTSVFRAFGKAGWTLDEAREFCRINKINAADNTIKIQLRRGAKGEEEVAPISKAELAELKPEVAKKEKAAKPDKKSKKKDKGNGNGKGDKKKKKHKPADEAEAKDEPEAKDEAEDDAGDEAAE